MVSYFDVCVCIRGHLKNINFMVMGFMFAYLNDSVRDHLKNINFMLMGVLICSFG